VHGGCVFGSVSSVLGGDFGGFGYCFAVRLLLYSWHRAGIPPDGSARKGLYKDMDIIVLDEHSETTAGDDRMNLTEEILAMFALLSPEGKRQYLAILQSLCNEEAAA
jgi:hypothetical protein